MRLIKLKELYGDDNTIWKFIWSILGAIGYCVCLYFSTKFTNGQLTLAIVFLVSAALSMQLCISDIKITKPSGLFFSKIFQWIPIMATIIQELNNAKVI
ncbi:TPA: hypothetical protein U2J52_003313 [Providencia rettgeri]|uniref:hypothetical protein n=1 Tax=unclassified Providencia TaxID=2633465 RepID=UPI00234B14F1|nr:MULTISPECIES: hypothetical protein [unclassified Providencia]HEM7527074.1 hypothetical protein [Providencia rettgeri]